MRLKLGNPIRWDFFSTNYDLALKKNNLFEDTPKVKPNVINTEYQTRVRSVSFLLWATENGE